VAEITALFEPALKGDRTAQDQLFRLAEPELRKLAAHWLRRYGSEQRVRATELIDAAFVRLVRPGCGEESDRVNPGWRHRGAFYAYVCRNMLQALIDMLRHQGRPRNPDVVRHILIDALREADGITQALRKAAGNAERIREVLAELVWQERTVRRIVEAGEDPSAVQAALLDLWQGDETCQELLGSGSDEGKVRRALIGLLQSERAVERLARKRDDARELPAEAEAPVRGLTSDTLVTLRQALDRLDEAFGSVPRPADERIAALLGSPPVSIHRAVVELKFFGGCTLDEIGRYLGTSIATVHSRLRVALAFLKEELRHSFPEFGPLAEDEGESAAE
jgi:RNA polymerase sigma factor (sigma-70 family)